MQIFTKLAGRALPPNPLATDLRHKWFSHDWNSAARAVYIA